MADIGSRSIMPPSRKSGSSSTRQHTGKPSVAYKDALDEALCYGWIDSLIKRIDDDRYARKFTPRKAESNWSSINIKRYNELKAAKKLAAPGLARSPEGRPVVDMARRRQGACVYRKGDQAGRARVDVLREPRAVASGACIVTWIDSAKRDDTKQNTPTARRSTMLSAGRKPGSAWLTGPSASSSSTRERTRSASFSRSDISIPRVVDGRSNPHADRRRPDDGAALPHRGVAALNRHRHDRHLRLQRHQERPALERQQRAGPAARAFRKCQKRIAVPQRRGGLFDGRHRLLAAARDRSARTRRSETPCRAAAASSARA